LLLYLLRRLFGIHERAGYLAGHIKEYNVLTRIHKSFEKVIIGIGIDHGGGCPGALSHTLIYIISGLFFTVIRE
jgi:hypothetical protein